MTDVDGELLEIYRVVDKMTENVKAAVSRAAQAEAERDAYRESLRLIVESHRIGDGLMLEILGRELYTATIGKLESEGK